MSEIVSVKTRPNKILVIEFADGRKGIFDVKPYLYKSEYLELNDPQLFQQVKTDGSRLYWPREHEFSIEVVEAQMVLVQL